MKDVVGCIKRVWKWNVNFCGFLCFVSHFLTRLRLFIVIFANGKSYPKKKTEKRKLKIKFPKMDNFVEDLS